MLPKVSFFNRLLNKSTTLSNHFLAAYLTHGSDQNNMIIRDSTTQKILDHSFFFRVSTSTLHAHCSISTGLQSVPTMCPLEKMTPTNHRDTCSQGYVSIRPCAHKRLVLPRPHASIRPRASIRLRASIRVRASIRLHTHLGSVPPYT